MSHRLIRDLIAQGQDIDYKKTDDLGPHYIQWIERTEKDGGPVGIEFYIDTVNIRVVVEHIGTIS